MPVLLAPVIAGAGLTGGVALFGGATIGTFTISYASIAAYGITAAALVGGAVLVNSLQGGQKVDTKLNVKQATPARVRGYGYCKLGGAFFALYAAGVLVEGFVHCEGPISGIKEWWLNDVQCTGIAAYSLSGTSGLVPGRDKLLLDSQLGRADQTPNPALLAAMPGWGSTRRLRGLANTVMRCYLPSNPGTRFQKYYPGGVPALRIVAQCALVYDPRDVSQSPTDDPRAPTTWAWSQNAGLAIMDYLTHPDGMALPRSLINTASFVAFANLCDQLVDLASGLNELRYVVLQGTYDLTEKRADVLNRLLATCDGELYQLGDGTIGIRGGQWEDPTVTVDDSMILGYSATQGNGKLTAFNQYRIRYVDLNLDFQQVEGDPWDDTVAQAAAGEVVPQDFNAAMSPYTQARRLAKIAMHKANPAYVFELNCSMAALDAFGERIITLTIADIGFSGTVYVSKFEINGDLSGCTMTVASLDASAYQWDTSQEGQPAPNPAVVVPSLTISDVVGLTLSLVRTNVSGSTNAVQIQAVVNPPADESYELHAQYRVHGTSAWIDMTGNGDWSAVSSIVSDGTEYDVQAAFKSFGGDDGTFVSSTITATADAIAPDQPDGFVANGGAGQVMVAWTNSTSANFASARLYRGAPTDTFGTATLIRTISGAPNQAVDLTDGSLAAGSYLYWLTAANASGVASTPVGPLTATVT